MSIQNKIDNISSIEGMKSVLKDIVEDIADVETKSQRNKVTKQKEINFQEVAKQTLKIAFKTAGAGHKEGLEQFAHRAGLYKHNDITNGLREYAEAKALDTGISGSATIQEMVSSELNELAILNDIILQQVRRGSLPDGSPYRVPKIGQRPNVVPTTENINGEVFNPTLNQEYIFTSADFSKSASMPAFTHEIIQDSTRDVEADCMRLIADQRAFHFISELLFADGSDDHLRGVLTSRIDSDNSYTEALKEDEDRDQEYLKVIKTETANELPVNDTDLIDFLVDVQSDISFKYQGNSAWYLSKEAFKRLRKVKVNETAGDNRPLLVQDFGELTGEQKQTNWSLLGKPVYVIDQLNATAGTANDIPLFYGDLSACIEFGTISGSEHVVIDEVTIKGQKAIYSDVRFYSVMHNNDAVRVVVAAA
ncbi:phage major capsid protein [Vibrio sp. SM6]|uniref:Phage major capsid protein n=1 Tax=Vibrio agarilyticus TaxID=2726741 RepID=A0A7X8YH58_9VIBR|nr:phage major capsid protein [Vibrio agarilyticus]NLS13012.1 phage major capsid protein [Vibrio agarilyticus]